MSQVVIKNCKFVWITPNKKTKTVITWKTYFFKVNLLKHPYSLSSGKKKYQNPNLYRYVNSPEYRKISNWYICRDVCFWRFLIFWTRTESILAKVFLKNGNLLYLYWISYIWSAKSNFSDTACWNGNSVKLGEMPGVNSKKNKLWFDCFGFQLIKCN